MLKSFSPHNFQISIWFSFLKKSTDKIKARWNKMIEPLVAYLKKSFLQYSFPSREKHFSVKVHLQSQHWTHLMCHGLSKTLSKNLSRIGFSQLAQWSIVSGDIPNTVRGIKAILCCSNVPVTSALTCLGAIQEIQRIRINQNNCIAILEVKCSSFAPRVNNPHTANGSKRQVNCKNSISETTSWTADHSGPSKMIRSARFHDYAQGGEKKQPNSFFGCSLLYDMSWVVSKVEQNNNEMRSAFFICIPFSSDELSGWEKRCNERTS